MLNMAVSHMVPIAFTRLLIFVILLFVANQLAYAGPGVIGRWANSAADSGVFYTGVSTGSVQRQYIFATNGTYTFHMEAWGGSFRPDDWIVINEFGNYRVEGSKLTVNPTAAHGVLRDKKHIRKTLPVRLEKVTYTWQLHYFEGMQETNLVLTPPAKTVRDGEFAINGLFPTSYLMSEKYQPEWTFK